ncbi:MAG: hypothetical protein J0H81_01425 [Sphingopyxis terrae]|nr:hypothetical protein [Sphingopyxis terrae]
MTKRAKPVAHADENAAVGHHDSPWWHTHSSAAAVLLVAALSSALYFLGSQRLATLADEFGFAAPPRSMGLQEVMMLGAGVAQGVAIAVFVLAWIVLYVGLGLLIRIMEYVVRRGEALEVVGAAVSEEFSRLRDVPASDLDPAEIDALEAKADSAKSEINSYRRLGRVAKFLTRSAYGMGIVGMSIGGGLFLAAGSIAGRLEARIIRNDVRGECISCFRYVTPTGTVVARPIFQADNFIVAYSKRGTVVIPMDGNLVVKRTHAPQPVIGWPNLKKAGPEEEERKPTNAR